jgi:hypothetical protein
MCTRRRRADRTSRCRQNPARAAKRADGEFGRPPRRHVTTRPSPRKASKRQGDEASKRQRRRRRQRQRQPFQRFPLARLRCTPRHRPAEVFSGRAPRATHHNISAFSWHLAGCSVRRCVGRAPLARPVAKPSRPAASSAPKRPGPGTGLTRTAGTDDAPAFPVRRRTMIRSATPRVMPQGAAMRCAASPSSVQRGARTPLGSWGARQPSPVAQPVQPVQPKAAPAAW